MHRIAAWVLACGLGATSFAAGCGSESGSDFAENSSGGASGASGASGTPGIAPGGGDGGGSGSGGPGTSGGPTCATAKTGTERVPVYLDIILDGSGSMDGFNGSTYIAGAREVDPLAPTRRRFVCNNHNSHGGGGGGSNCPDNVGLTGKKWIAARGALKAFFDTNAPAASPFLGVGMYLFSSTNPGREPLRLLDATHAAQLWSRIAPETWPNNGTPLEAAVEGEAALLRAFEPSAPLGLNGRRAILLITDGVPDPGGQAEKEDVRQSVVDALDGSPSVVTAVIGVGDPASDPTVFDATFLSGLAKVGGVSAAGCDEAWTPTSGTTPCHLQVTPGEKTAQQLESEMTAAINGIAGSLTSCELTLDKTSPIDPSQVNVLYVDATGTSQVAQDPQNGWTYDNPADPSSVILHGQACDRLKADDDARVDIVIGCPTGSSVVN